MFFENCFLASDHGPTSKNPEPPLPLHLKIFAKVSDVCSHHLLWLWWQLKSPLTYHNWWSILMTALAGSVTWSWPGAERICVREHSRGRRERGIHTCTSYAAAHGDAWYRGYARWTADLWCRVPRKGFCRHSSQQSAGQVLVGAF